MSILNLDEEALALEKARFAYDNTNRYADHAASLEAAIRAYLEASKTVTEEEVERGARAISAAAVGNFRGTGLDEAGKKAWLDANWPRFADDARACLTAARLSPHSTENKG
jgi:hypothetical protein